MERLKLYSIFQTLILIGISNLPFTFGLSIKYPNWNTRHHTSVNCKEPRGQFEHPKYCDLFINCWDGVPTVEKCHAGLVFNEKESACDYPSNVNCNGRGIQQPNDTRCEEPYGTFSNPENCNEYFVCKKGVSTVHKCPKYSYFRPQGGVCPDDDDTNCYRLLDPCYFPNSPGCDCERQQEELHGTKPQRPSGSGKPQSPAHNCEFMPRPPLGNDYRCERPNGTFRNYDNCAEYIECLEAVATVKTCPLGSYFQTVDRSNPSNDPNCFFLGDGCYIEEQKTECKCQSSHHLNTKLEDLLEAVQIAPEDVRNNNNGIRTQDSKNHDQISTSLHPVVLDKIETTLDKKKPVKLRPTILENNGGIQNPKEQAPVWVQLRPTNLGSYGVTQDLKDHGQIWVQLQPTILENNGAEQNIKDHHGLVWVQLRPTDLENNGEQNHHGMVWAQLRPTVLENNGAEQNIKDQEGQLWVQLKPTVLENNGAEQNIKDHHGQVWVQLRPTVLENNDADRNIKDHHNLVWVQLRPTVLENNGAEQNMMDHQGKGWIYLAPTILENNGAEQNIKDHHGQVWVQPTVLENNGADGNTKDHHNLIWVQLRPTVLENNVGTQDPKDHQQNWVQLRPTVLDKNLMDQFSNSKFVQLRPTVLHNDPIRPVNSKTLISLKPTILKNDFPKPDTGKFVSLRPTIIQNQAQNLDSANFVPLRPTVLQNQDIKLNTIALRPTILENEHLDSRRVIALQPTILENENLKPTNNIPLRPMILQNIRAVINPRK